MISMIFAQLMQILLPKSIDKRSLEIFVTDYNKKDKKKKVKKTVKVRIIRLHYENRKIIFKK